MVLTAAASALGSVKAAYDIAKGAHALQVSTEVKLAISDMIDKLVDAKRAALDALDNEEELQKRINELEEQIREIKKQASDLENYEPRRFYPGVTVYVTKGALSEDRDTQKLCENCYRKGEKSELYATAKVERRYRVHTCPSCRTDYHLGTEIPRDGPAEQPRPEPAVDRGDSSWLAARGSGPTDWMGR